MAQNNLERNNGFTAFLKIIPVIILVLVPFFAAASGYYALKERITLQEAGLQTHVKICCEDMRRIHKMVTDINERLQEMREVQAKMAASLDRIENIKK